MRKNKFVQRKQDSMKNTILLLLLIVGLGYAILQSNLNIQGIANLGTPTWDIHWENVQVKTGSVTASTPTIDSAQTTVTYSVVLNTPGDYYEFTVDAVNDGTIDGMIESITSKLNGTTITTLPAYLEYSIIYSDGAPLAVNQILAAGDTEKYKVKVKYSEDISVNQIPASNQTLSLQFTVKYKQADNNAISVTHPVSFSTDDWSTIINAVRADSTDKYNVGDTKTIDLGSFGTRTLRIANKSTPSECSTQGFSQTACGFVLEFADLVVNYERMNPSGTYKGVSYQYGWNVDGWPATTMRTYVNTNIYNAIPEVLRNAIIDTTVVSGHGKTVGEKNFTSIDKLYLLSTHEVYEDVDGNPNAGISYYDTAYDNTRQLDYYSVQGVTTSNKSGAIKPYVWWLRTPYKTANYLFYIVNSNGGSMTADANIQYGVSPAFRIG